MALSSRRFACLPVAVALLGLAACGGAPQPAPAAADNAPAETQAIEDTQTQPSEAAQAQIESGTAPVETPLTGDAASQMLSQMAGIAGAMHAAAKLCDPSVSDAQLGQARDQLRQEFTRMGGDADTFDSEFGSAHTATSTQFNQATPAQQTQMCAELEAMAGQAPPPPPAAN